MSAKRGHRQNQYSAQQLPAYMALPEHQHNIGQGGMLDDDEGQEAMEEALDDGPYQQEPHMEVQQQYEQEQ